MTRPAASDPASSPEIRVTLDHVAIAAKDLDAAMEKLARILPAPPSEPEEVPSEGVRLRFIDAGGPRLEILQSTRPDSAIARFLERRGGGLHHLSFRLEGIEIGAWFEELRARGVRLIGAGPREGSGGSRVFFVHPDATGGILVEFSQEPEGSRE